MTLFESVKQAVTTRQAAERYGLEVNRSGMAICPFHEDHTPSLMLMQRLSEVTPLNAKKKSAEIEALLEKYIPAAEKMMTRMKKLKKICTKLKAELAQLEKEKDASKESVLRRLELEQQVRELENAQKILEAIPENVLAQYRTAVKEENAYSH